MKVSLNWVREFTDVDLSIGELVEKIGAQLGAVDGVENLEEKYKGIVVVEVLESNKHPNADKLSVCIVDDGGQIKEVDRNSSGHVQIVCGAPNVRAGMLAVWIPPGTVVPSTAGKDPFMIEAREIRGIVSNGMLASAKELGLGDNHEGILEIDEKLKLGKSFAESYKLNDHIIDIENKMFTHRPDCFGMLGVARELAGIEMRSFKSPDWYKQGAKAPSIKASPFRLIVNNDIPKLVPRFCLLPISDVKVEPSPLWLQARLRSVGVRPINNIVDITNYFMLETAQPLHAYDYDKLNSGRLDVRLSKEGEELKLLGGKKLKLLPDVIVITDGQKSIGLGGIMGGADTEVDESTKNIVLECGTFDMNATRRSAMAHGLFTDAATRFTKSQSPLQNRAVITKAAEEIIKIAGGGIAGDLIDEHLALPSSKVVNIDAGFINKRLGLNLKAEQIEKILTNVEFKVVRQKDNLTITSPFWRTDIEIPEDIVEEVGRLFGYDKLLLSLPGRDLTPASQDKSLVFKQKLSSIMSAAGANEMLSYSFVHSSLLGKAGQDAKDAYKIRNALSPDLQYYRLSLTPSLLDKVHANIKQDNDMFVLFEIGKTHSKQRPTDGYDKVPKEIDTLCAVYAEKDTKTTNDSGAAYYYIRAYLDNLASRLGVSFVYTPLTHKLESLVSRPYDDARSASISVNNLGEQIGIIGEFKSEVVSGFKLPRRCAGFEIDITKLIDSLVEGSNYQPLPKYPKVHQEITIKVPSKKLFSEVSACLENSLAENQPPHSVAKLTPVSIYKKEAKTTNYSFKLDIASHQRTLQAEEINILLDDLAKTAHKLLGAERV